MKRFLILLTILVSAAGLNATTVLPLSFDELSRYAPQIVNGTVVSVSSALADDGYIYSKVTLEVNDAVPSIGGEGGRYSFTMIGGEYQGKRLFIEGMPRFSEGQELILFLNPKTESVMGPTMGLWQGVFFVKTDEATGSRYVTDSQGLPINDIRGDQLIRGVRETGGASSVQVNSFFSEIRARR